MKWLVNAQPSISRRIVTPTQTAIKHKQLNKLPICCYKSKIQFKPTVTQGNYNNVKIYSRGHDEVSQTVALSAMAWELHMICH